MKSFEIDIPVWIEGDGPESDIVISTRARLARSLASLPFPSRATREDLYMVAQSVGDAAKALTQRFPRLVSINMEKLSREERNYLLDAHIVSVEQIKGGHGRVVVLEPSATLSIMINEEDHIRLQVIMSGLEPQSSWELVDWADDVLAGQLEFGYSEKYGYLTASVSNVGTGLRVSAMMHLAGLALKRKLNAHLRAAYDLGVSIRGLYGEGTRSIGDLFQVSNEVTLGISEREIVDRVRAVALYLLSEERAARKELIDEESSRIIDSASRSLEALQSAESITAAEAISLMSPIRLAAESGLVSNSSRLLWNQLLVGMRVGEGEEGDTGKDRARLLRNKLADVKVIFR